MRTGIDPISFLLLFFYIQVKRILDISNPQQYIKQEECCNARTILVKDKPFH